MPGGRKKFAPKKRNQKRHCVTHSRHDQFAGHMLVISREQRERDRENCLFEQLEENSGATSSGFANVPVSLHFCWVQFYDSNFVDSVRFYIDRAHALYFAT